MAIFNNLSNLANNSSEQIISFPKQPWEIKTSRTYNDYIVECAMRMFTNTYLDSDKINIKHVVKNCISRSKMLIDELAKSGYLNFEN